MSFLDKFKNLLGKKPTTEEPVETPEMRANAVRKPSSTQSGISAQTASGPQEQVQLQQTGAEQSNTPPPLKLSIEEQAYLASRGADQAARTPRRTSSTYSKLQALSASGTGSAGVPTEADQQLNNILERLDENK